MTRYKHLQIYTRCLCASVALALGLTSCVDDNGIEDSVISNEPCIEFILSADDLLTRTVTGDNSTGSETQEFLGPEKMMNTVDIFFYANDAGENDAAVYYHHIDNTSHGSTEKIMLDESLKTTLFGSESKCKVYTVVNVTDDAIKAGATLAQLRAIKAKTATFATEFDGFAMFTKASEGDVVTYDDASRKATGILTLRNLASKIDLFVSFGSGDTKTVSGVDPNNPEAGFKNWNVWNPSNTRVDGKVTQKGSAEVYLVNGSTVVPLKGWSDSDYDGTTIPAYIGSDEYFDLRNDNGKYSRRLDEVPSDTDIKVPEGSEYFTESAIYSYPNKWTTDIVEQYQTYLMLKVNWLPDDIPDDQENVESDLVETYYKIPINISGDSENRLLHNRYYRVKVNINTLGGINFGAPLELETVSCEVLPWGSSHLDADIHEIRAIEIAQIQEDTYGGEEFTDNVFATGQEYVAVMQNTKEVTIPFYSTHEVYLKSVTIKYWNFNTSDYVPELVSVIAYRKDGEKMSGYEGTYKNGGLDAKVFTLTDEKLNWFKENNQEPNGIYIDNVNQKLTFYHSVYPLAGDGDLLPELGEYKGVYKKVGDKPYSPYYIDFELAHTDEKSLPAAQQYSKHYKIKQYPGVYITFEKNSGTTISSSSGKIVPIGYQVASGTFDFWGNAEKKGRYGVYVNGGATATFSSYSANDGSNSLQLGGIGGTSIPDNTNMYSIHVTQLEDDDQPVSKYGAPKGSLKIWGSGEVPFKFHVGDPRTKNFNNNLGSDNATDLQDIEIPSGWDGTSYSETNDNTRNNFRKVPAQTGTGNAQRLYHTNKTTLSYYYPTTEGQSPEQAYMIAPVFRLASGYTEVFTSSGIRDRATDNLSRENARRRCAALQDNGFPAGRWRVPTIGEMYFFKMLSNRNVLPDLFPNTRSYWSAQYLSKFNYDNTDIRYYPSNDLPDHKWVRCVYDDWYWVKSDNITPDIIENNRDKINIYIKDINKAPDGKYYSTDGDIREMFVWGDKLKNNPQQQ